VNKLNEYFINTNRSLAGRSHGYENVMNLHFYVIAVLICVFIGIIFLKPVEERKPRIAI
jgi:hypothetical protein